MSRFNVLSSLVVAEDEVTAPVSTTTTAAVSAGATTVPIAANGTSYTSGMPVRIGTGATAETAVATTGSTGTSLKLATPLRRDHRSGEPVVEQDAERYGPTAAQIATVTSGRESSDIFVGESKFPSCVRRGYASHKATINLLAVTAPNIALALGLPRTAVGGSGTLALPHQVGTNGQDLGTLTNAGIFLNGLLEDGTTFREEFHGVSVDPTGVRIGIARGQDQVIPVKILAGSVRAQATNAAPLTGGTALLSSCAEIIDSLTEGGYFRVKSGGLSTTTTATAAKGTNMLALTAATGVVAGTWLRVGTGATAQIVWVHSLATLTATLRTYLLGDVASGASVVEVEPVPFLDLADEGSAITVGGSVREDRQGDQEQTTRFIVDSATLGVELGFTDVSLANFARAYGLPDPGVATSQVIANMGLIPLTGVYARGLTASGKTVWLITTNVYSDVSSVEYMYQSTGEKPPIPYRGKASSLLVMIYA